MEIFGLQIPKIHCQCKPGGTAHHCEILAVVNCKLDRSLTSIHCITLNVEL